MVLTGLCAGAHQSAVLHVFLQALHSLPAHTLTFWTGDSAFGHDLQLPALFLTSWQMTTNQKTVLHVTQEEEEPV